MSYTVPLSIFSTALKDEEVSLQVTGWIEKSAYHTWQVLCLKYEELCACHVLSYKHELYDYES